MRQIILILLMTILSTACRDTQVQEFTPALLSNPGQQSHEEIQQTISTALNGVSVMLADDVFTMNSVLVIERGMQWGIDRPPEMGRDLGRPGRFQLVSNGTDCIIIDEQSGVHWPLARVKCIKEE